MDLCAGCGSSSPSPSPTLLLIYCPPKCQKWLLLPYSEAIPGPAWLSSFQLGSPLGHSNPHPRVWSCTAKEAGKEQALSSDWGRCQGSCGKLARVQWRFNLFSLPCFRSKKYVCTIRERRLDFSQPSCQSHCFSKHPRELIFLMSGPGSRVPDLWLRPLTPQGDSSPVLCPLLGAHVLTWSLLFPSYPICWIFLTAFVVEVFLSVFSYFQW